MDEQRKETTKKMIGETLKKYRQKSGLSQAQLARQLNVSRETVSAWESGKNMITVLHLIDLCDYYHCPADMFLHRLEYKSGEYRLEDDNSCNGCVYNKEV